MSDIRSELGKHLAKACTQVFDFVRQYSHEFKSVRDTDLQLAAINECYWAWADMIGEETFASLVGISREDLAKAIVPAEINVSCNFCSGPVQLLARTNAESNTLSDLYILCPSCTKDFHRKMARETQERSQIEQEKRSSELKTMPYGDYLQTPEWKERRDRQVKIDGGACRLCGSTGHLNVHHRTYDRRGDEGPGDLVTLCQPCHQTFHENRQLAKLEG